MKTPFDSYNPFMPVIIIAILFMALIALILLGALIK